MGFDIKKYCHISDAVSIKGESHTKFNHGGLNIFYIEKGSCDADCHGTSLSVSEDEILVCDGNVELDVSAGGSIVGFNINGIIAERYCKDIETAFVTDSIFAPYLPRQIKQVADNYDSLSEIYLSNTAFEVINTLSHGEKKAVIGSRVVVSAIKMIKANYMEIFGVEEMALRLDISKSHLVREFFKHTGTTPGKYLVSVRIDAVKYLLTNTSLSLTEIAMQTGFSGDNYLCKAFKKATGETPMSYRQRVVASQYLPNQLTLQIEPELYIDTEVKK